ncbi:hypothetical protein KC19_6G120700 [Ceratodon purpureus]|uniref:Pentatricopeptide repeat-containing protein n=1 Tax=Ceratodon purpureus TaxID=3225 RepID=A0A8T0HIT6_CERPU|nr:hypothetical protein KC19_6G120700 [Ceratodon purpureus]
MMLVGCVQVGMSGELIGIWEFCWRRLAQCSSFRACGNYVYSCCALPVFVFSLLAVFRSSTMFCTRIVKFCSSSSFPSLSRFFPSSKVPGSAPKPRLRKSGRLQRDVLLLSKILRSKASWGASTAKRLKQSNVEVTPFHVTEVLRLHRHSIEPAWRFFKWAQQQKRCKRGLFMYSKMLQLLGDARRFDDLWSLLDEMKRDSRQIPPAIFLGVIRNYVKADQMDGALKAFCAMEKYGCKPTTLVFNSMIDIFRAVGDYAQVESLFRNIQDSSSCAPDVITYTMMIDCRGKAGQIEAAFDLFQEMHRKGYKANVITYSSLISSLGKAGRISEACNLLSGMQINGCKPNNVTYNGLIVSLGGAGQAELAYSHYKEMIVLGLVPNVSTQAVVVASLVKIGNLTEAHTLFQTAANRSRDTEFDVMKSVVGSICKSGQFEAGLKFFQDAKKNGYEPSVGAYSVLIYSLSKSGCAGEALDLFQELARTDASPDLMALNALTNALVKEQIFDAAIDVIRLMIKQRVGDQTYAHEKLVTLLCKTNRFKDAYEVISQELPDKGFPRNVHLYNKLVYQLGKAGHTEKAFQTFERMSDEGCHPDTGIYNVVINLLGSVGKVDLAHQLFQQMKEKGCEPNLQTYDIMVGLLVRAGRSVLSTKVCQEMVLKHIEYPEGALKILRQAHENTQGLEDTRGYSDLVNMLKGDGSALVINNTP